MGVRLDAHALRVLRVLPPYAVNPFLRSHIRVLGGRREPSDRVGSFAALSYGCRFKRPPSHGSTFDHDAQIRRDG